MMDLQELADKAVRYAGDRAQYCDVRCEQHTARSIIIQDGRNEGIKTAQEGGIGIRLMCDGAWGFCSISSPETFRQVAEQVDATIKSTIHYSHNKKPVTLAPVPQNKAKIEFPVAKKPTIQDMLRVAHDCNDIIRQHDNIIKSSIDCKYEIVSKCFASSEGTKILQNYTDTIIHMLATAHGFGQTQSVDITEGGRGGMEKILDCDVAFDSARDIAVRSSELLHAKPVKAGQHTVVLDPSFVSLLTHEILGHPSEADRVLGREMAWAGGAWWSGMLGKKIGSDVLQVFDDPTIQGSLGWYSFDDEGVRSARTILVEDGFLKNHMQSRETATVFDAVPSGNMRAAGYSFMPLIRMACTCIGPGDYNQDEMIKEVTDGYLISGMKVPSIDMRRYDWSISCQYAHRIKNGEIDEMCRDVIVSGTAPDFFDSVDACGDDFTVIPITNCGKGDPMQQMAMGNGGPTVRARATVRSI